MKKIMKDALILFAITLIAGLALGAVYTVTKDPIAKANQARKEKAYKAVFAKEGSDTKAIVDQLTFTELSAEEVEALKSVFAAELGDNTANTLDGVVKVDYASANVSPYAYVFTVTNAEGYGGNIQIAVGMLANGTITGVEILSISETPGLGMNAKGAAFINQFNNVNTDKFTFTKTGKTNPTEIDAISSATFTTRSMTNGVNAALAAYRAISKGGNN